MVYNQKLAVAIKANGRVLREEGDTVYLPFGCEYSILIKNLHSTRALVSITIDGTDVGDGTEFVINPGDSLDLKRFIRNGNMNEGNSFKFIERTESVEQHRGIEIEDGLVCVNYQFERQAVVNHSTFGQTYPVPSWTEYPYKKDFYPSNPFHTYSSETYSAPLSTQSILRSSVKGVAINQSATLSAQSAVGEASAAVNSIATNDVGITVPGSVCEQKFVKASPVIVDGAKHSIVVRLKGQTDSGKKVEQPVTVKHKPKCTTCGRVNKATSKFCSNCGTSLELV